MKAQMNTNLVRVQAKKSTQMVDGKKWSGIAKINKVEICLKKKWLEFGWDEIYNSDFCLLFQQQKNANKTVAKKWQQVQ